jgi:hypothetical protein
MKKIKIMRLLTYSFLVCNAYSAKSTDIIFSVFGTEMIASEMVDRGILVKKRIECTAKYKPEEPQIKEQRSVNDIYQLSFFSSDGACLRLKIETENTKTRIILLKVDSLKSYAISAYDYADCVDYILSGGEYFKELNQNGEFSFIPDVIIAGSDIRDGAEKEFNSEYSISCAGHDIRSRGSFFNLTATRKSWGLAPEMDRV